MEWMIDTADLSAVRSAFDTLPVAGVTTNPSILKKEMTMGYYDHLSALKSLCRNASLHVQLGSNTCEGMLQEANILWNCLGRDIYLKIPVTEEGLKTILRLKKEGANITATACGCNGFIGLKLRDSVFSNITLETTGPERRFVSRYAWEMENVWFDRVKVTGQEWVWFKATNNNGNFTPTDVRVTGCSFELPKKSED